MSLESGSVTLKRFYTTKALPEAKKDSWLDALNQHAIKEKELQLEGENDGWAVLGNELSNNFTYLNSQVPPYVCFAYRRDSIKVPGSLIELHLKSQIAIERECGEGVSKTKKQEIKDDIINDLITRSLPNVDYAGVLIDTDHGEIFFSSSSDRMVDGFCQLFYESFHVQLIDADYATIAHRLLDHEERFEGLMSHPNLDLVENLEVHPDFEDSPEMRLGSAFLTWFYYHLQDSDSSWSSEHIEEIFVVCEDQLTLAGESMGSREVTLRQGAINTCRELSAALQAGKGVSKAKFLFYRGDEDDGQVWSFLIDKKNYVLGSLKLPKVEVADDITMLRERFDSIREIHTILDDIFLDYLEMRTTENWPTICERMRHWVFELDLTPTPKEFIESGLTEEIDPEPEGETVNTENELKEEDDLHETNEMEEVPETDNSLAISINKTFSTENDEKLE